MCKYESFPTGKPRETAKYESETTTMTQILDKKLLMTNDMLYMISHIESKQCGIRNT